ncbi:uncharacterized protein G2W53_003533 [Senna tora]|uniref:Uncharacterized protein n=1 Tax=Senna tora TaxID=362788 RepID=A0A834XAR8_9FABA|nr:uncharacterized protein G2W53_020963 [Senna tora]KAF7837908.1 uncharacterized protein G2W53_006390 [Senna tora]KAF7841235.1 uncharacterized protein G2W53_003533 [Senna tora]
MAKHPCLQKWSLSQTKMLNTTNIHSSNSQSYLGFFPKKQKAARSNIYMEELVH